MATWNFQVIEVGDYLLAVEAKGSKDRMSKTVIHFYDTGSSYVRQASEALSDIELIADKKLYLPGEIAHLSVRSPIPEGKYLLTTEREGIFSQKIIRLKRGQNLIDIPVQDKHVPVF